MSSSIFIESPIKTTINESLESYETESSNNQEINKDDLIKSGPSNLVVVYGSNGVQVNRDELEKLIADESNLSTISVIRLTSPTPSMKQDDDDDEEQKTKSKHSTRKNSNNNDNESNLDENLNEDSCGDNLSESNSSHSDDDYSDDDLLATLSGAERNKNQNKKHRKKVVEKPESAGLIIEGFYPPDQAKILAKEILNISGINRLTFKLDKKFQELQLLALSNDHCYTPLLSPTQEPIIEKVPDNKKVPIQPPEKIQQKLINLKQSAIAKQRSSSNDSTNKLDAKHKNSTDELTGDNESDSDDQSDEESESVDTDNDRDSDLDFSVYGAGKRKVRRTKKISINKITNKRQKRQSSHEDEDLNKKKTKGLMHRLSTEGIKIKTEKDLFVNKIKTIDSNIKVEKIEKPENLRNDRVVVKMQQKLPTTPLIALGMGKSTSLLRKTFSESETTIQPVQGKLHKEALPRPLPQNIVVIKPQEKSTGGFTDISKYLSKLGGEGEIVNPSSSGSIIINRKFKESTAITHTQIQQQQHNFMHHQKKYGGKESIIPATQHTQISGSSHEDKELIDSLVNDESLQPMPNHSQMNIPSIVKMLESTEQTILNQRSNEISTFQQQHQIAAFADTIANANVDDIPEDLLKDVAELIDNNTLEEFAEKQALQQNQQNNSNIIDFETTIPTNLLVGTPPPSFVQHIPEQSANVKYLSVSQVSEEPISAPQNPHPLQTQSLIKPAVQVMQRNGRVITLPPIEAPNTRAKRKAATTPTVGTINQTNKDQKLSAMKQTKSSSRRSSKEASSKVSKLVGENRQKRVSTSSQKQSEKSLEHNDLNPEEDDFDEDENDSDFNEDDDPDKLWCICRQPHNNRFMICCDVCEDWFHGTCVNVTKAMGLEMEQNGIDWTCPKCVRARKPTQRKISEMFEKKAENALNVDIVVNKTPAAKRNIAQTSVVKTTVPIKISTDNNVTASPLHIKSQIQKKTSELAISKTIKNPENIDKSEQKVQQQIVVQKKEPINEIIVKVQAPRQIVIREPVMTEQTMSEQQMLREQALREQALKAQALKAQTLKAQAIKEQIVKDQTIKEQATKEQTLKDQIIKGQIVKEQTIKEQVPKEQAGKEILTKERITKPKQTGGQNIECIVCKKSARPNSIYCSDECIRKHAQNAISMKLEKGGGSDAAKKKSSFEEALGAAAVIVTPKKVDRISVFERKSGRIITGLNAPTTITLKKWLQENQTFEVVQPGSIQQVAIDKKRLQSQSSVESLNTPENSIKDSRVEHGVIKIDHSNLTKLSKPFSLVSTPSTSKSQSFEKKLPTKYSPSPTLKPDKIDKNKHVKQKLVSQKESKEPKEVKQNQNAVRSNIVKNFRDHLTARMNEITDNDHPKLSEDEIAKFANEIEEEMYYLYNKDADSTKYKIKYRSLQFNLKDRKNTTLFHKICAKMVGVKQLVRMSAEELASQELAAWRQQEHKHQLEMIKNAELDLLACTKNYVLKTHKGEEVIESKTSDCISLDIAHIPVEDVVAILNNSIVSSTSELEQSTSSLKDSYKHHHHHESKTYSTKHSDKKHSNHSKDRDQREKHHKSKNRHKEKSKKRSRSRSRDRNNRHSSMNQSGHKDDRVSKEGKKSHDKHRDKKNRDKSSDKSTPKVHISPAYSTSNSASLKSESIKSKPVDSFNLIDQILESSTKPIEQVANLSSATDSSFLKDENSQENKNKSTSFTSPLDSDQEPTSTVQIATPPIYEDASDDPYSIYVKQLVWWTGSINMIDVATFQIHIQPISGEQIDLKKDLSTELDVVGRISPDTVWDYIAKIKMTSNKEILIVRLIPSNETENIGYSALHMYLNNRNRLGVVKSETPTIKDFYLFPLGANKPLPHLLKTNDNMGIFEEEPRPDLLLGIIIRVKRVNYIPTSSKRSTASDISIISSKRIRRDPESVIISHKDRLLERADDHYTPPGSPSVKVSMTESHSILNIGGKLPDNTEEPQNIDEVLHRSPVIMIQDDEPYSPGGSSEGTSHSIPGLSISKEDEELKRKMDEINRQIEVQEMEIAGMLGASNSSSDTYSPSNSLSRASLPTPSLANISIPSNLHQILASLKKPPPPPADDEEYNPEDPINSLMEAKSSKTSKSSGSRLAQLTEEELLSMVPDDIDINIPKKDKSSFVIQPPPPGLEDEEEFS